MEQIEILLKMLPEILMADELYGDMPDLISSSDDEYECSSSGFASGFVGGYESSSDESDYELPELEEQP